MDPAYRQLIEALHQAAPKYVLAATGGGTSVASLLLSIPGGSRSILEVTIPYNELSLADFLGRAPENCCDSTTALAMAMRAQERACWLAPRENVAGIACTASLASDRPKRGDHRFYIAIHGPDRTVIHSLTLSKAARDREGEEAVLAAAMLNALAESFGAPHRVPVSLRADEIVQVVDLPAPDLLTGFVRGKRSALFVDVDGRMTDDVPAPAVLLPGSFNPVHDGHWALADIAASLIGQPVVFELSVANVDKPSLRAAEIRHRLKQFEWRAPVWLTRAPTFVEKARKFPGAAFVVGVDTAERIVAPRYYQGSEERMVQALQELSERKCRFLVAGRLGAGGTFLGCADIVIPPVYRGLFTPIPESDFRSDISSTQLRPIPQT